MKSGNPMGAVSLAGRPKRRDPRPFLLRLGQLGLWRWPRAQKALGFPVKARNILCPDLRERLENVRKNLWPLKGPRRVKIRRSPQSQSVLRKT